MAIFRHLACLSSSVLKVSKLKFLPVQACFISFTFQLHLLRYPLVAYLFDFSTFPFSLAVFASGGSSGWPFHVEARGGKVFLILMSGDGGSSPDDYRSTSFPLLVHSFCAEHFPHILYYRPYCRGFFYPLSRHPLCLQLFLQILYFFYPLFRPPHCLLWLPPSPSCSYAALVSSRLSFSFSLVAFSAQTTSLFSRFIITCFLTYPTIRRFSSLTALFVTNTRSSSARDLQRLFVTALAFDSLACLYVGRSSPKDSS